MLTDNTLYICPKVPVTMKNESDCPIRDSEKGANAGEVMVANKISIPASPGVRVSELGVGLGVMNSRKDQLTARLKLPCSSRISREKVGQS